MFSLIELPGAVIPEHLALRDAPCQMPAQELSAYDFEASLRSEDCRDCPDGHPRAGFHDACSSVLLDSALQFILDDVDFDEAPLHVRTRARIPPAVGLSILCQVMLPLCRMPLCPACLLPMQASASTQLSFVSVPHDLPSLDIGAEPSKLAVGRTCNPQFPGQSTLCHSQFRRP